MIQVRHKKKTGAEGLSFYHTSLLCCLHQMLEMMELNQQLVSSYSEFDQSCSGQTHFNGLWADLRNIDIER